MVQATKYSVDPGWKIIFKDFGLRIEEVLRRAELPGDLFARETPSLYPAEFFSIWTAMGEMLDDPLYPLKIGQMISTEAFSPPIFASLCSPDLAVAMQRIGRFKQLIGPMSLTPKEEQNTLAVSLAFNGIDVPVPPQLMYMELVFQVYLARLATREHIVPLSITAPVPFEPAAPYAEYFGIDPKQGDQIQVVFSGRDAHRPFLTQNMPMWNFFEPQLEKRLSEIRLENDFAARVRATLFEMLPAGLNSADEAASRLAVSKRSLQRYLNLENTSFQKELKRVREKLARHYLESSSYSGAEISLLLGYDDPNSFFRAFRNWTGLTPGRLKASAHG